MPREFTAIYEKDGDWVIDYRPEAPGANGQGRTKEECRTRSASRVELILEDRLADALAGAPQDAEREPLVLT